MIDDQQKILVAKNFATLHPAPFAIWAQVREHASNNDYYLTVYDDLIVGVYGDCYGVNAEFDVDDNQMLEATKFEVVVDQFELRDGRAEIFCFEIVLDKVDGGRIIEAYVGQGGL